MDSFHVGDRPYLAVLFTDTAGVPTDPEVVRFLIRDPAGTRWSFLYAPGEGEVERTGPGAYQTPWLLAAPGVHWWGYSASGGGVDTAEEAPLLARAPRALGAVE